MDKCPAVKPHPIRFEAEVYAVTARTAIPYLEPTAPLLPASKKTGGRSRTVPAPRGPGVKYGRFSSGCLWAHVNANAQLGSGSGMATGDAETGTVRTVRTSSVESVGIGVDREL